MVSQKSEHVTIRAMSRATTLSAVVICLAQLCDREVSHHGHVKYLANIWLPPSVSAHIMAHMQGSGQRRHIGPQSAHGHSHTPHSRAPPCKHDNAVAGSGPECLAWYLACMISDIWYALQGAIRTRG